VIAGRSPSFRTLPPLSLEKYQPVKFPCLSRIPR
jgi:hypothetical protein